VQRALVARVSSRPLRRVAGMEASMGKMINGQWSDTDNAITPGRIHGFGGIVKGQEKASGSRQDPFSGGKGS